MADLNYLDPAKMPDVLYEAWYEASHFLLEIEKKVGASHALQIYFNLFATHMARACGSNLELLQAFKRGLDYHWSLAEDDKNNIDDEL